MVNPILLIFLNVLFFIELLRDISLSFKCLNSKKQNSILFPNTFFRNFILILILFFFHFQVKNNTHLQQARVHNL